MVPTVIERGGKVIKVFEEDENPGVVELGGGYWVKVRKHRRGKPGHHVHAVRRDKKAAGMIVASQHIGDFCTSSRSIGRGPFRARWVSNEEAAELSKKR